MKEVVLIGYSGHAQIVCDTLLQNGRKIAGYCELNEKSENPMNLKYFGSEINQDVINRLIDYDCFIAIGDNKLRAKVFKNLSKNNINIINVIHPSSVISEKSVLGKGVFVGPNVVINTNVEIQDCVICNTSSIIEHDVRVDFCSHVAPGSILCGAVRIGMLTLIGAGSIILPLIRIGDNVIVGAGSIVLDSVNDDMKIVGKFQRNI